MERETGFEPATLSLGSSGSLRLRRRNDCTFGVGLFGRCRQQAPPNARFLKRLRATPLSPVTILGAHVFVKLVFTVVSLGLLVLAGRQFLPGAMDVHLPSFTAALLLSTLSILSIGFVIASIVPTARFAQPIGAARSSIR